MEPKDLNNSNEELNAKPEVSGDVNTPVDSPELQTEAKTEPTAELDSQAEEITAEAEEEVTEEIDDKPVVSEAKSSSKEDFEFHKPDGEDSEEEDEELDEETANAVIAQGKIDYSGHTEVELINALRDLLATPSDDDIKDEVDRIKINFYKKHRANVETEKAAFLADGGVEDDFEPANAPYEDDLKNLLKEYRQQKSDRMKHMEEEKEQNLEIKYQIIEDIKSLVNRKESINKTFQDFRDLQQKWRDTGLVPQSKLKDLWETYHHHVENFYDYIKINKELRDLDLKKNLGMARHLVPYSLTVQSNRFLS